MEKGEALQQTISLLEAIPGGPEVAEWFGGWPEFGDAEILELRLVRRGPSLLRISATASAAGKWRGPPFKHAVFDFTLRDTIDIRLDASAGKTSSTDWRCVRRGIDLFAQANAASDLSGARRRSSLSRARARRA